MLESSTPDRTATVLLLLAIAGFVDAIGLGETGRFFVSFMSGDVTLAALSLAAWPAAMGAVLPLGLVALFVAGVSTGTMIGERAGRRAAGLLLLVVAMLLALAIAGLRSPRPVLGIVPLPVAMGLANIVLLAGSGTSPGATYVTGTLVRFGIALGNAGRAGWGREIALRAALCLALLIGAVAGALGRARFGPVALAAPVAVLVLLGSVDLVLAGRRRA